MPDLILAVNSGSSSLKCSLFSLPDYEQICRIEAKSVAGLPTATLTSNRLNLSEELTESNLKCFVDSAVSLLEQFLKAEKPGTIRAVGHRIVQGGSLFDGPCILDEEADRKILSLVPLAPLHNPANLACYHEFSRVMPEDVKQVAVFDSTLFKDLPESERTLPLPKELTEKYGIRRYGAHGISHGFLHREVKRILNLKPDSRVITMHIGSGASLAAFKGDRCIATSMGLTPLGGVMMGTRSGDIDPSAATYLAEQMHMDMGELTYMLTKRSGLLGISGITSDVEVLEQRAYVHGDKNSELALDMFTSRIADFVAAYTFKLGHVDALVFSGGVYENSPRLRKNLADILSEPLGFKLDKVANIRTKNGITEVITAEDSKVVGIVIPTQEEKMIAMETARVIGL